MSSLARFGSTALVTGASSGIGEEFARVLAAQKINLVLVARNAPVLQKLAAELTAKHGVTVVPLIQDLSQPAGAAAVVQQTKDRGIVVDILVNNAGVGTFGELDKLDSAQELAMIRLNVEAVVELTRAYVSGMKERKRGAVILISSLLTYLPVPKYATYKGTKGFINTFGDALHDELNPYSIAVLTVVVGVTDTAFHGKTGLALKDFSVPSRTPQQVVATALSHLGHRKSVIDGAFNRIGFLMTRILPAAVQKKMFKAPERH